MITLKDRILLMEPLPTVSKVFSFILKAEKQKTTQVSRLENNEMTALLAKLQNNFGNYVYIARGSQQQEKWNMMDSDALRGFSGGHSNLRQLDDFKKGGNSKV